MKKLVLFSALVLLVSVPLGGQAPPAPATPPPVPPAVEEAMKKAAAGDVAGAIQGLETAAKKPGAPAEVRSLLGALYVEAGRAGDALQVLQPLADAEAAEPAVLYNAGRAALALGRADVGRTYLERSLAREPASPAARELGLLWARQGRIVESYRLLRPWALRTPRDLEARLTAASLALRLERPVEAEEMLTGLANDDPAIRLLRGEVLVQKGDGRAALELLAPLEKSHPPGMDLEVRRALAEARLLAGEPKAAVTLLAGKASGSPVLALLLGRAQRQAGDLQGAEATLKPFVDKLPDDPKGLGDPRPAAGIAVEYGRLRRLAGDTAGAVAVLEKATRLHPSSPEAWQVLGEALAAAGRAEDSKAAQAKAQELTAAVAEAKKAAAKEAAERQAAAKEAAARAASPARPRSEAAAEALRLLQASKPEEALAAARRGIAASPQDLELRAAEVRALLLLKRWQDAFKAAEEAVKAFPDDADAVYLRGAARMALQDKPGAERDLRRAVELDPRHVAALNDLGVVLAVQGKTAEAKQLFRKVLEIQPGNPTAEASLKQLDNKS